MKTWTLPVTVLTVVWSSTAFSACEGAAAAQGVQISDEKRALRKGAYEEMCVRMEGLLIDGAREDLGTRLTLPTDVKWPAPGRSGPLPPQSNVEFSPTVLVYVVDANGDVSRLSILQTSGSPELDAMAARSHAGAKYRKPATLDGKAVPIFVTRSVKIARRDVTEIQ